MKINKFELSKIKEDDFILILGHKKSGKSVLIKNILYYFSQNFIFKPYGLIFSPDNTGIFNNIIPSILREYDLTENIFEKIVEKYKLYKKRIEKGVNENTSSFLIFDDCIIDNDKSFNQKILKLFKYQILLKLLFIISIQNINCIEEYLPIRYLFLSKNILLDEQKKIYKLYSHFIPTFDIFSNILNQCTQNDYEFLVLDLNQISNDTSFNQPWNNRIYWYKSDIELLSLSFKLCSNYYWNKNELNEKEHEVEKNNIKNILNKKRSIMLKTIKDSDSYFFNKINIEDYKIYENKIKNELKEKEEFDKRIDKIFSNCKK